VTSAESLATDNVVRPTRIAALDGLRGVAILLVVIGHAYPYDFGQGGVVGVTLFFVLSGYLITRVLTRESNLRRFYWRRFVRLYPALIPFLLLAAAVFGWGRVWAPAFYVANVVQIAGTDLWPLTHTWSLAVEEHFYLIWPWVFLFVPRRNITAIVSLAIVLSIGWRLSLDSEVWAYQGTFANAFALLLGCLLAIRPPRWRPGRVVGSLAVLIMILLGFVGVPGAEFLESGRWIAIVSAFLGVVAVASAAHSEVSWLSIRALVYFGTVSYGWYLWHLPIIAWVGAEYPGWEPVGMALSLAVAALSWRMLERPLLERDASRRSQRSEPLLAVAD
jgi:peptidoglycan/LPS O-acetylase OafA/YrhL